jgi:hypothetical protein
MSAHLIVEPEVARALGTTPDALAGMTLRAFFDLAYYNGFDVRVKDFDRSAPPNQGSLTVKIDREQRPILTVGR